MDKDVPWLRLLGPVRVDRGGKLAAVKGAKARAVLADLGLRVGQLVTVDQLIDDLWGERPPSTARNTVQVYISAVRRALDNARGPLRVERSPGGYRLVGSVEHIDWYLFQALVSQGRLWSRQRDPATAGGLLTEALGLWEGPPLADVGQVPLREAFAPGMDAAYQAAAGDRMEAELAAGQQDLVPELFELVSRYPTDERFAAQLMEALSRAGRRAEALEVYAATRRRLVEELGLEPGTRLRELQRIVLAHEAPPPAAPAPAPVAARPRELVRWRGELVGRETEMADVLDLLGTHRLVTIAGPPGVGKSRLAVEVARRRAGGSPPVTVVALDALTDPDPRPEHVAQALAEALGASNPARKTALEQVRGHLLGRSALVLLDNCEHVREACASLVDDLLDQRPDIRVLTTSTQPLGARDETLFRLGPLALPDPGATEVEEIARSAAVTLFCVRAREVQPALELSDETAGAITAICRSVEGLPLAIELASARTDVLSTGELSARLADQLAVLTDRGDQRRSRHRSLQAALATSWALLGPAEQALYAQLSCFAAGFTLEAAESVSEPPAGSPSVLDLLHGLIDKSLVVPDITGAETWFRILEPVRQHGRRQLAGAGAETAVRERHAHYMARLAETAARERRGPQRTYWQSRLATEQSDLYAALDWALDGGRVALAAELSASLWWWWTNTPRVGLAWYRRVLTACRADTSVPTSDLLRVLLSAAVIASYLSNHEAMAYARDAYEAATRIDDKPSMVRSLQHISDIAYEQGDLDHAVATGDEALRLAADLADGYALGRCTLTVAYNHLAKLDLPAAHRYATDAARSFAVLDDRGGVADARLVTAEAELLGGDADAAEPLLAQILAVFRREGSDGQAARAATLLAFVMTTGGRRADAAELIREAFDIHLVVGHPWSVARDVDLVAAMAAHRGDHAYAATLLAAASAVRTGADLTPVPRDESVRAPTAQLCREALGEPGWRAATHKGAAADLDTAVALARDTA